MWDLRADRSLRPVCSCFLPVHPATGPLLASASGCSNIMNCGFGGTNEMGLGRVVRFALDERRVWAVRGWPLGDRRCVGCSFLYCEGGRWGHDDPGEGEEHEDRSLRGRTVCIRVQAFAG